MEDVPDDIIIIISLGVLNFFPKLKFHFSLRRYYSPLLISRKQKMRLYEIKKVIKINVF